MKRVFDLLWSFIAVIIMSPLFVIISLLIVFNSKGPVFYRQIRVGRFNIDFKIYKFRTMKTDSDKLGLITVGDRDPRITAIGFFLRKTKLDELPQLINVLFGSMSFVGPRPEVRKYVNLYNKEQMKVLDVRPGITDLASIEFRNESEILARQKNPDEYYINSVMPIKLAINLDYLKSRSLLRDIGVILKTFAVLFK